MRNPLYRAFTPSEVQRSSTLSGVDQIRLIYELELLGPYLEYDPTPIAIAIGTNTLEKRAERKITLQFCEGSLAIKGTHTLQSVATPIACPSLA